jgi:hypothetical protein
VMPKTSKPTVGQLVIADRSAEMRTNITECSYHAVSAEHEDVVVADPARELTGRFQFAQVADFDKAGRGLPQGPFIFFRCSGFGHDRA